MARRCCITECSVYEENYRQLFLFPKDEESKMEWLNAIGQNFRKGRWNQKNFFICNLHFTEDCFHNDELEVWKDGQKVIFPRKVLRIKKGSIPSLFKKDDFQMGSKTHILETTYNDQHLNIPETHSLCKDTMNQHLNIPETHSLCEDTMNQHLNIPETHSLCKDTMNQHLNIPETYSLCEDTVNQYLNIPETHSLCEDTMNQHLNIPETHSLCEDTMNQHLNIPESHSLCEYAIENRFKDASVQTIPNDDCFEDDVGISIINDFDTTTLPTPKYNKSCWKVNIPESHSAYENNILSDKPSTYLSKRNVINLSPTSARRVSIANQIMSLKPLNPDSEPVISTYSKMNLMNDWLSRDVDNFPDFWEIDDDSEGVLFVYLGDISCEATRSIFVKEDMTVEIKAYNCISKYPILEKVTSLEDIRSAMIKIVCLKVCETVLRGKCENVFFLPKRGSRSHKCNDCQKKNRLDNDSVQHAFRRLLVKKRRRKEEN